MRSRRRDRLTAKEKETFSGAFWTGRQALEMGLIDGLGEPQAILEERLDPTFKLKIIEQRRPIWRRGVGSATVHSFTDVSHHGGLVSDVSAIIEERLLWARFGL